MTPRGDCETIHLIPNPRFLPGQPFSYESVLCRLGGWWTMSPGGQENGGTLTAREVITMTLAPC